MSSDYYLTVVFTASCERPRRRRDLITRRPAVVAVRAKNPCLRARFCFFGWYVRFVDINDNSTYKNNKSNRVWTTYILSTPYTNIESVSKKFLKTVFSTIDNNLHNFLSVMYITNESYYFHKILYPHVTNICFNVQLISDVRKTCI